MVMMNIDLQRLIQTLASDTRGDLERAAERCINRGGRDVLVEGLLRVLLEQPAGQRPSIDVLNAAIEPALRTCFKPALLARKLAFTDTPELVTHMAGRCVPNDSGARYVDQWIESRLLPQMADRLLTATSTGECLAHVHARLDAHGAPACESSQ